MDEDQITFGSIREYVEGQLAQQDRLRQQAEKRLEELAVQLDKADRPALDFDNKAAFALVMDMFVIQIGQFDKCLIRLFKPITHDAGVIIKTVNKRQVILFQGT